MNNKEILNLLKPIADTFGIAVEKLWKIFIRKYLSKGISQVFLAIVLGIFAYSLKDSHLAVSFIFAALSIFFGYCSIQYIVNPSYCALDEIIERIKNNKND